MEIILLILAVAVLVLAAVIFILVRVCLSQTKHLEEMQIDNDHLVAKYIDVQRSLEEVSDERDVLQTNYDNAVSSLELTLNDTGTEATPKKTGGRKR